MKIQIDVPDLRLMNLNGDSGGHDIEPELGVQGFGRNRGVVGISSQQHPGGGGRHHSRERRMAGSTNDEIELGNSTRSGPGIDLRSKDETDRLGVPGKFSRQSA